ncbi:TonB-dependent receptor plug domain-containing protein [Ningiella sp. W23]|uniref:TonB-dependent receptor plug domain-containing protein n=1 Tax=Ningiella sp. W23 TaxID=3023715 RepID=UPI0037584253
MIIDQSNYLCLGGLIFGVMAVSINAHGKSEGMPNGAGEIEVISIEMKRSNVRSEPTEHTKKLLKIAGIDGDPLAAVFSLPGVIFAGGDFGGEPAVRGSSPDDNVFFIDGIPVDYIFHLFGDSIFNEHLLQDFRFNAAGFDASYGGGTGGVFDVYLRDPKSQSIRTRFDLSFLKTGLLVEGSVNEDQQFYASYRHSLVQFFLPEGDEDDGITILRAPQSDDYQSKYQWNINTRHQLTFAAHGASDRGAANISSASEEGRINPDNIGDAAVSSSFATQGIEHEYFGDDIYLRSILSHTSTDNEDTFGDNQFVSLHDEETNLRILLDWQRSSKNRISFGLDVLHNDIDYAFDFFNYNCTDTTADCLGNRGERVQASDSLTFTTIGFYAIDRFVLTDFLDVEFGARIEHDNFTEETYFHPRLALTWDISERLSAFSRFGQYSQFPNIEQVIPEIGNRHLNPYLASHIVGGFSYDWKEDWDVTLELYSKDLSELGRANNDESLSTVNANFTNDISGAAYGAELLVNKHLTNNWYGWFSLGYSKSDRTDELTQETSDYVLDTPWIVNMVLQYQYTDSWDFGLRLSARDGARYTPILGLRENPNHENSFLPIYGPLNSRNLPNYFRLDVEAAYTFTAFSNEAIFTMALINATNNENVIGYFYAPDGTESLSNTPIESEDGIGIFPSIGITLNF